MNFDALDAVGARGGPLNPVPAGVYSINNKMLDELARGVHSNHASNLGALIANNIARDRNVPAYVVDPVTTDDFPPEARISGVPGIERKSRSHALNIRYCCRKTCTENEIQPASGRFIVGHFGGGFSIAAVVDGRILDVNDALLGTGPFSVERAGTLPLAGILSLVFDEGKSREDLERQLSKNSGLMGYTGTRDLRETERRIRAGDETNELIYEAMIYQIAKEIGSMFAVLKGRIDGLILTGGLTHSNRFVKNIKDRLPFIAPVFVYPGSFELEALASGVYRVLSGKESARNYQ